MDKSPLESAVGAVGPGVVEALKLVGNETRLAILLVLWDAYERPDMDDNALPFSILYRSLNYNDRGNFRYHLRQLEGQYIRRTEDDQYEIRHTGLQLVRTVIGGAGLVATELEPTEIDRTCEFCGAQTAVCYEDGLVFEVCTECEGRMPIQELPDGYLHSVPFPPAGVIDRTPEELIDTAEVAALHRTRTMFRGLCATCSGPVDAQLELCTEHDSEGTCDQCERRDAVLATFQCRICKASRAAPLSVLCGFHPAVIAFCYDHGMTARWNAVAAADTPNFGEHDLEYECRVVSEDPPRAVVGATLDENEFQLTFDESVNVVDVSL